MSELAALNDGYMSPISQDDDDRIYSPVDGNESYRGTYIRRHNYSPASDEHSPCSVVPDNEDEPRQVPHHDLSPVSDIDRYELPGGITLSPVSDIDRYAHIYIFYKTVGVKLGSFSPSFSSSSSDSYSSILS